MGVITYPVPAGQDIGIYIRVFYNILPDTEEGCFCTVLLQEIQYPGGNPGMWSIIKSQVYGRLLPWRDLPYITGIKLLKPFRNFLEEHSSCKSKYKSLL
ncbi:hypothetical protein D9M68_725390 [compost metagenome]